MLHVRLFHSPSIESSQLSSSSLLLLLHFVACAASEDAVLAAPPMSAVADASRPLSEVVAVAGNAFRLFRSMPKRSTLSPIREVLSF